MKLLGSTKSKITKNKNSRNVLHFEITKVALIHCNIVNNDYQQDSRVLSPFVPNKSFNQLLHVSPKNVIYVKTIDSELSYIKVIFTDQNSKWLEIEDQKSIPLDIN